MIILVAPTAGGKDTLAKFFQTNGYTRILEATTRLPRPNEVNGVDYWFKTMQRFEEDLANNHIIADICVTRIVNGEEQVTRYGLPVTELSNNDQTILTSNPTALRKLVEYKDKYNLFFVYMKVLPEVQKQRLRGRGDEQAEIENRCKADLEKFTDIEDIVDLVIDSSYTPVGPLFLEIEYAYNAFLKNKKNQL